MRAAAATFVFFTLCTGVASAQGTDTQKNCNTGEQFHVTSAPEAAKVEGECRCVSESGKPCPKFCDVLLFENIQGSSGVGCTIHVDSCTPPSGAPPSCGDANQKQQANEILHAGGNVTWNQYTGPEDQPRLKSTELDLQQKYLIFGAFAPDAPPDPFAQTPTQPSLFQQFENSDWFRDVPTLPGADNRPPPVSVGDLGEQGSIRQSTDGMSMNQDNEMQLWESGRHGPTFTSQGEGQPGGVGVVPDVILRAAEELSQYFIGEEEVAILNDTLGDSLLDDSVLYQGPSLSTLESDEAWEYRLQLQQEQEDVRLVQETERLAQQERDAFAARTQAVLDAEENLEGYLEDSGANDLAQAEADAWQQQAEFRSTETAADQAGVEYERVADQEEQNRFSEWRLAAEQTAAHVAQRLQLDEIDQIIEQSYKTIEQEFQDTFNSYFSDGTMPAQDAPPSLLLTHPAGEGNYRLQTDPQTGMMRVDGGAFRSDDPVAVFQNLQRWEQEQMEQLQTQLRDTGRISTPVEFENNKSDVPKEYVDNVVAPAARLLASQADNIEYVVIEGHASRTGSERRNIELSWERASNVSGILAEYRAQYPELANIPVVVIGEGSQKCLTGMGISCSDPVQRRSVIRPVYRTP